MVYYSTDDVDIGRYLMNEILVYKLKQIDPKHPHVIEEDKIRLRGVTQKLRDDYYN